MNDRIRELARQAGYTPDMFGVGHWDMPECKKFAELIVQECVKVVDDMADPEDSDRYFWAIQNASNNIRKHFGVEE